MDLSNELEIGEHRQAVAGFVRRLVGDRVLAEDIAQETFVRVQWTDAGPRGDARLQTWLCAIALNLVRDHFSVKSRARDEVVEKDFIENVPSQTDDGERAVLKKEM
jgi:RNA polymerase sigma-70 factor (ECF subfamily)